MSWSTLKYKEAKTPVKHVTAWKKGTKSGFCQETKGWEWPTNDNHLSRLDWKLLTLDFTGSLVRFVVYANAGFTLIWLISLRLLPFLFLTYLGLELGREDSGAKITSCWAQNILCEACSNPGAQQEEAFVVSNASYSSSVSWKNTPVLCNSMAKQSEKMVVAEVIELLTLRQPEWNSKTVSRNKRGKQTAHFGLLP